MIKQSQKLKCVFDHHDWEPIGYSGFLRCSVCKETKVDYTFKSLNRLRKNDRISKN